jgi:replicative superfamily II helicase
LLKKIFPSSILIFCSSKNGCETTANHLTTILPKKYLEYKKEEKIQVIKELEKLNNDKLDFVLSNSIKYGIAFHHSGLSVEERAIIEGAYKDKIITILAATSTLAAGVNLPAARVIFRTPYISINFIDKSK